MNKEIIFRKVVINDRSWIDQFISEHWGSEKVVVHSEIYFPSSLDGFVAEFHNKKIGLVSFLINGKNCEIITLNSILERKGVGSELLNLVIQEARACNCCEICLTTTNDNVKALDFYQKNGFKVRRYIPNAVLKSRELKPEIPEYGDNNIPIRDELELVLNLKTTDV